jgi:peptidoglycan/xylan/chitin deacetylase (PgdA/CDA1 family)
MKSIVFFISFVSAAYIDGIGFRCGRDFNNDICPDLLSCSGYGYCGSTIDYYGVNCQSNCNIPTTTSIVPTPTAVSSIFRDSCNKEKTIALTFDDGPSDLTNDLLTYLSNNKIPATFFIIGNKINTYRSVIQRMYKLGFEIGTHTWDHSDLTLLTDPQIRLQVSRTNNLIKQITGKFPKYFRAPYLNYNERVDKIIREFNMLTVSVNLDTNDWKYQASDPSLIYKAFTDKLPNIYNRGYISLQHDRYKPSVDLVPSIVSYIKSVNFTLVSMNDCLS